MLEAHGRMHSVAMPLGSSTSVVGSGFDETVCEHGLCTHGAYAQRVSCAGQVVSVRLSKGVPWAGVHKGAQMADSALMRAQRREDPRRRCRRC